MKLRDMFNLVTTRNPIRIHYHSGNDHIAKLSTLNCIKDSEVTDIWVSNNELNIRIEDD